jgi:hypothetical protein
MLQSMDGRKPVAMWKPFSAAEAFLPVPVKEGFHCHFVDPHVKRGKWR